jgi:hypothetical protein
MLINFLTWLRQLIYITEDERTCENGYHEWSNWQQSGKAMLQIKMCKRCDFVHVEDL